MEKPKLTALSWWNTERTIINYRAFSNILIPSWLKCSRNGGHDRVLPTTYLDGFRGVVAFLVFLRHFSLPWNPNVDYGLGQGIRSLSFQQLPLIRILFSGPNVPVFLVVSGYVMSIKPLRMIHGDRKENLLETMISSIFRRAVRLFTPPLISSFLVMISVRLDMFSFPYEEMPGHIPHHPQTMPNFPSQLIDWMQFVFKDLTVPWTWRAQPSIYGNHLWTTPLQFRCSMVLFLVIIGLASCRRRVRQSILAVIFLYCFCFGRWDVALYLSGMFMAEHDMELQEASVRLLSTGNSSSESFSSKKTSGLKLQILWGLVLFAGCYLSSFPRAWDGVDSPYGYKCLFIVTANYRYWHSIAAVMLIWCLSNSKAAQRPFTTSLARYLGKISFSVYIVHEPLLHTVGFRVVKLAWNLTGQATSFQYGLGFGIAFSFTSLVLLWVADVFHRAVDEPSANLARWLEKKCQN